MADSDQALRELVTAIVAGDGEGVSRLLAASPELAKKSFRVERHARRKARTF